MDLQSALKLGERLDIEFEATSYKSVLHEIGADNTLWLLPPTRMDATPLLQQCAKIIYYREDGLFVFDAEIVNKAVREQQTLLAFQVRSEPQKVQRRSSMRLKATLEVGFSFPEEDDSGAPMEFSARTVDISEAGMCFQSQYRITPGAMLECELKLDEDETIELSCVIVRTAKAPKEAGVYHVGVQFLDMSDGARRRLSWFILKEQVKFGDDLIR